MAREEHSMAQLVAHNDPKSPVAEAYRTLRTNLSLFLWINLANYTFTSTNPGW